MTNFDFVPKRQFCSAQKSRQRAKIYYQPINLAFAKNFKIKRQSLNLSIEALAQLLNVPIITIQMAEGGRIPAINSKIYIWLYGGSVSLRIVKKNPKKVYKFSAK